MAAGSEICAYMLVYTSGQQAVEKGFKKKVLFL